MPKKAAPPKKKKAPVKTAPVPKGKKMKAVPAHLHKPSASWLKMSKLLKLPVTAVEIKAHLVIAILACGALAGLARINPQTYATLIGGAAATPVIQPIGIEHDQPQSLTLIVARKAQAGYVQVLNTSSLPVKVSLPEQWKRLETVNAPLSSLTEEKPAFGFVRWTIPGNAGIRLNAPIVPDAFTFSSPSHSTVAVTVQRIEVETGAYAEDVLLLQNYGTMQLWKEAE